MRQFCFRNYFLTSGSRKEPVAIFSPEMAGHKLIHVVRGWFVVLEILVQKSILNISRHCLPHCAHQHVLLQLGIKLSNCRELKIWESKSGSQNPGAKNSPLPSLQLATEASSFAHLLTLALAPPVHFVEDFAFSKPLPIFYPPLFEMSSVCHLVDRSKIFPILPINK